MGYIALYRKYRPTTFSNIIGQENVTKILRNQIKNNKNDKKLLTLSPIYGSVVLAQVACRIKKEGGDKNGNG
mgnify:CR=1 FL=1